MQWQRVLHGFGTAIENAGRIHSVYEFTLKAMPGRIIRVRVVETPEGQFFGLPDHVVESDTPARQVFTPPPSAISPEKALQDAVRTLMEQVQTPCEGLRLVRLQNW